MDVEELKRLAGIDKEPSMGENLSLTGTKKAEYQRKHKIQPGTQELSDCETISYSDIGKDKEAQKEYRIAVVPTIIINIGYKKLLSIW